MTSGPAIALRRSRFSETSLMITWLTMEHGKLRTAARGVLRPNSPLSGRVDLFHETRIFWVPARRGDVHALREAEILEPFLPAEPAHLSLLVAAYFAELTDQTTQPEEPQPALYDLLRRALGYLRLHAPSKHAVRHFENEAARLLGIREENKPAHGLLREYVGFLPVQRAELWPHLPEKL
jgi:DNA repair protein RecO (recombination protein O)